MPLEYPELAALTHWYYSRPALHDGTASLFQLAQEDWKKTVVHIASLVLFLLLMMLLWGSVLATMLLLSMLLLSMMRLVLILLVLILLATISTMLRRNRVTALEIDVYPAGIVL